MYKNFKTKRNVNDSGIHKYTLYRLATVAIVLLVILISAVIYYKKQKDKPTAAASALITAGTNKASIILNDGEKINLSEAKTGLIASRGLVSFNKQKDGELQIIAGDSAAAKKITNVYSTLEVPRGGQWKIILNDGTKVWLNAESTLYFPNAFVADKREVYLTGEGYFEIVKDPDHPFVVHAIGQIITASGASVNVNAYESEEGTRTTTIEGTVDINSKVQLSAGQQGVGERLSVVVKNADTGIAISWTKGYMSFNDEPLQNIMQQVSRWYDVKVNFQSEALKKIRLSGTVSRSVDISAMLDYLSISTGVSFKVSGHSVTVVSYKAANKR